MGRAFWKNLMFSLVVALVAAFIAWQLSCDLFEQLATQWEICSREGPLGCFLLRGGAGIAAGAIAGIVTFLWRFEGSQVLPRR